VVEGFGGVLQLAVGWGMEITGSVFSRGSTICDSVINKNWILPQCRVKQKTSLVTQAYLVMFKTFISIIHAKCNAVFLSVYYSLGWTVYAIHLPNYPFIKKTPMETVFVYPHHVHAPWMSIWVFLSKWIFWHEYYYGFCMDTSTQVSRLALLIQGMLCRVQPNKFRRNF